MIEHFKSFLLLVLIGLSLFLTYQLWYGQKPAELTAEDVYEQVDVEAPRPLEDALVPEQIVIPGEEGSFLLKKDDPVFDQAWNELSKFLQGLESTLAAGEQNAPPEEAFMCLASYFQPLLPVGHEKPWLPGISGETIEILELHCLEDSLWLVVKQPEEEEKYLLLEQEKVQQLLAVIEEIRADGDPPYSYLNKELIYEELGLEIDVTDPIYVPRDDRTMELLDLSAEHFDRELLLKTFFVDHNLARVIEERDGSLLYTDGEKGLRITDIGFEYSHPRLEEGSTTGSYKDALRSSANLLGYHGGWPENLRLEEVEFTSRGGMFFYESEWNKFYKGYPFITGTPTRISFNDLGLFHLTRFLFEPAAVDENNTGELTVAAEKDRFSVASWTDALLKALEETTQPEDVERPTPRLRLKKMELAYAVTGTKTSPQGTPAWVIVINNKEVILRADNLEIINEEDLL